MCYITSLLQTRAFSYSGRPGYSMQSSHKPHPWCIHALLHLFLHIPRFTIELSLHIFNFAALFRARNEINLLPNRIFAPTIRGSQVRLVLPSWELKLGVNSLQDVTTHTCFCLFVILFADATLSRFLLLSEHVNDAYTVVKIHRRLSAFQAAFLWVIPMHVRVMKPI